METKSIMTGIELITNERIRQFTGEGWTPEQDACHTENELALLAVCYALPESTRQLHSCRWRHNVPAFYPKWNTEWWKPTSNDRIKELTKAGALIAAEIDRLIRVNHKQEETEG